MVSERTFLFKIRAWNVSIRYMKVQKGHLHRQRNSKMNLRQEYSLVYGKDLFRKRGSAVWPGYVQRIVRGLPGYNEARRVSHCGSKSLWWACDGEESFGA